MADFTSDMTKAASQVEKFTGRVQGAAQKLGVVLSGASLAMLAKNVVTADARLDDLAETTSLAVETLSSLERTAFVGGHSFDQISSGASKVARSVAEARGGNQELISSFAALGISQQQLKNQRFDELYVNLAKAIATADNQQNAIAHATKIAGKAAADSIPFWKDLSETGLEQARTTAKQAAEAERLEKETRRLMLTGRDLRDDIVRNWIPGMADWIEANRKAIEIAGGFGKALSAFVFSWEAMSAESPAEQIERLSGSLAKLEENLTKMKGLKGYEASIARANSEADVIKKQIAFLRFLEGQQLHRQGQDTNSPLFEFGGGGIPNTTAVAPPSAVKPLAPEEIAKRVAESMEAFNLERGKNLAELMDFWNKDVLPNHAKLVELNANVAGQYAGALRDVTLGEEENRATVTATSDAISERIQVSMTAIDALKDETALTGASRRELEKLRVLRSVEIQQYGRLLTEKERMLPVTEAEAAQQRALIAAIEERQAVEREWLTGARIALDDYADAATNAAENVGEAFTNGFRNAEDAAVEFARTGKLEIRNLADSIISDLIRIQVRQQITGPIAAGIGTDFFGFGSSGPAAGTNAEGVPFNVMDIQPMAEGGAFKAFKVGENGPELFVPDTSGSIIPNQSMGGGVNIFPDLRGASAEAVEALHRMVAGLNASLEPRSVAAVERAYKKAGRRSGMAS